MLISTEIGSFYRYGGNKKVIELLKNGGFEACDFTMMLDGRNDSLIDKNNYITLAKDLRSFIDGEGLIFNQAHAPFPSAIPNNKEYNVKQIEFIKRALEVSGILGVKICVVHPCNYYSAKRNAEEIYKPLEKVASDAGVMIGLENMWCWDNEKNCASPAACSDPKSFCEHLDLLDEKLFCACLDIGHAEMQGLGTSAEEMILKLNKRLKAIHLHDNDRQHDLHKPPFICEIDYKPIIAALKKIKYCGDITFESDRFVPHLPTELYPAAVNYLVAIGNYFRSQLSK